MTIGRAAAIPVHTFEQLEPDMQCTAVYESQPGLTVMLIEGTSEKLPIRLVGLPALYDGGSWRPFCLSY